MPTELVWLVVSTLGSAPILYFCLWLLSRPNLLVSGWLGRFRDMSAGSWSTRAKEYRLLVQNQKAVSTHDTFTLVLDVVSGAWAGPRDEAVQWDRTLLAFHGPQRRSDALDLRWVGDALHIRVEGGMPAFATWTFVCRTTADATALRMTYVPGEGWWSNLFCQTRMFTDKGEHLELGTPFWPAALYSVPVIAVVNLAFRWLLHGSDVVWVLADDADWAIWTAVGASSFCGLAFAALAYWLGRGGDYPVVQGFLGWDLDDSKSRTAIGLVNAEEPTTEQNEDDAALDDAEDANGDVAGEA